MTAIDLEISEAAPPPSHPPCVPFALSVGISGHRSGALGGEDLPALREEVRRLLRLVGERARRLHRENAHLFSPAPPRLVVVSPLADGADQIVAEAALDLGFALQAVLPFPRDEYRQLIQGADARERLDNLLARAERVLELPGDRYDGEQPYVMVGRATVAHSDLMLAIWDGKPARGRGGTADVVRLAIARGTAVLHIPVGGSASPRLLWSGFDPAVVSLDVEETVERAFDEPGLDSLLREVLLPPAGTDERCFLDLFQRERKRRFRARVEYPLMLAATGVRRFRSRELTESHCAAQIDEEWRCYRDACVRRHAVDPALDVLEGAYSWTDRLATYFAQTYRSGHVFNFVLGGLAVCMGLSTFMADGLTLPLAVAEFVVTLAIIVNTRVGMRHEWHRRWLDYRQLAERLRPMRSLKLLGLASPDPPGTPTYPVASRWIDWYAQGVWRAMGCPSGIITTQGAAEIARAVGEYEVAPQVAYHERNSRQIEQLDERLEKIAAMLFWATLFVCVATAFAVVFEPHWLPPVNDWFSLVSSGFPALGTAVFGIRFQGDFGGSAIRSRSTANALRHIEAELMRGPALNRAADLAEQAARTMLVDLDEWRLVNQQQELDLL